jgi:hypothetical protein
MAASQQTLPTAEESAMAQAFAQDRPTIEAAVNSFISLISARSLTASAMVDDDDEAEAKKKADGVVMLGIINPNANCNATSDAAPSIQQQVLQVARAILESINAYTFPIHNTVAISTAEKPAGTSAEKQQELFELSIVAQLWNGLVESNQKPSRFLGRRALRHVWNDLDTKSKLLTTGGDDKDDEKNIGQAKQQLEWLELFERLLFHENGAYSLNIDNDAALIWGPVTPS